MARKSKFSPEMKKRAVRMVLEQERRYGSRWETLRSVAGKIGCTAESLRKWTGVRLVPGSSRSSCGPLRSPGASESCLRASR